MKKTKLLVTIIGVVLLAIAVVILPFATIMVYHNFLVSRFEKSLQSLPIVRLAKTQASFGLLWGNSNHCDAEVIGIYDYSGSVLDFQDKLEQQYQNILFPFAKKGHEYEPEIFELTGDTLYLVRKEQKILAVADIMQKELKIERAELIKAPFDVDLESTEVFRLVAELKKMRATTKKDLYVAVITDQTNTGLDMLDLRCN